MYKKALNVRYRQRYIRVDLDIDIIHLNTGWDTWLLDGCLHSVQRLRFFVDHIMDRDRRLVDRIMDSEEMQGLLLACRNARELFVEATLELLELRKLIGFLEWACGETNAYIFNPIFDDIICASDPEEMLKGSKGFIEH